MAGGWTPGSHCVSETGSGFPVYMLSSYFSKLSNLTWIAVGTRACSIERWPTGRLVLENPLALAQHVEEILEEAIHSGRGHPSLRSRIRQQTNPVDATRDGSGEELASVRTGRPRLRPRHYLDLVRRQDACEIIEDG